MATTSEAGARGQRTAVPTTPATIEAVKMAIFAAVKSAASENASPAIKRDIVKPMPASAPAPASCRQVYSGGLVASPTRTANQASMSMPAGFPTTSPRMIASIRLPWVWTTSSEMITPAFASAKSGNTT